MKKSLSLLAATAAVFVTQGTARAQETARFALNRFEPSERGSEWFVADTLDLRGNFRPALGLIADYGHKPYVLLNPDDSENTKIVGSQLFFHVGGSLVLFDRLRIGASLPLTPVQEVSAGGGVVAGQRVVGSSSGGFGDLRLAADVRLVGTYGDAFTLALGTRVWLPTGEPAKLLGDGSIRIGPRLAAAGDIGDFAYAASVGVTYRGNDAPVAGHPTGSEVNFNMAAGARFLEKNLLIGPELAGSTIVSDGGAFFGARTTPLALLGSGHYTSGDFRLGLGAGPGLSHAAGTAEFRGLMSLEWAPAIPGPPVVAPPPPPPPPPPPSDRDGDGIPDQVDACPDAAGIKTDDPATNGCPPDRDSDGDGVLDKDDACPDVPGIKTNDPKTNGCPDTDRDKDGVLNDVDACPDAAGPKSADPKTSGCPRVFIKAGLIQILEQPKFDFNKAAIKPESDSLLAEVAKVMTDHPEIKRVRVEGHTDNVGAADYNQKLSQQRAEAVLKWLSSHGIAADRLTAKGMGKESPLVANDTEQNRALNRRVEFHIESQEQTVKEMVKTPQGDKAVPPTPKK